MVDIYSCLQESGQIVQNRHPDFLDILLTAKDDSGVGFTDLEIRNEVDTFTFEGYLKVIYHSQSKVYPQHK